MVAGVGHTRLLHRDTELSAESGEGTDPEPQNFLSMSKWEREYHVASTSGLCNGEIETSPRCTPKM